MIRAGATRLMDLRAEAEPPGYGVPVEHWPLEDCEAGQHVLIDAAARRLKTLVDRGERVGVYCQAGRSRTAAVALAYLVASGWSLTEAERRLRVVRPQAWPAPGLGEAVGELADYQARTHLRHESITVEGVRLHAVHCPGSGPAVILLHGAYGSWTHWWHNLESLQQYGDVWALDLPGFGESDDWPHDFEVSAYLAFLETVLETISADPVILAGYSFGAHLAAHLAIRRPSRIHALWLVSLVGRTGDPARYRPVAETRFPPHPTLADRLAVVRQNLSTIHLVNPPDARTVYTIYQNIRQTRLGPKQIRGAAPPPSNLELVRALRVPTLMMWGHHDPFCQPSVSEWVAACRAANPDIHTVVAREAAHWCQYEAPQALIEAVNTVYAPFGRD